MLRLLPSKTHLVYTAKVLISRLVCHYAKQAPALNHSLSVLDARVAVQA